MRKAFTLLVLFYTFFSFGQEKEHKKYFQSFGTSIPFLDLFSSPVRNISVPLPNPAGGQQLYVNDNTRYVGVSFLTLNYCFRYNIYEANENRALALSMTPSVGISSIVGETGFISTTVTERTFGIGNFNLPVLLEYEFGEGSTSEANIENGGMLGIGVDYSLLPLYNRFNLPTYSYLQLAFSAEYRHKNTRGRINGINFLFCLGTNDYGNNLRGTAGLTLDAKLSWVKFIGRW
jgi:hypothetical protein